MRNLTSPLSAILNHDMPMFSAIWVVIWFLATSSFPRSRHLSVGLPRLRFPSTAICNIVLAAWFLSRICTYKNHLNFFIDYVVCICFTDVPRSRLVKYPLLLRSIAKLVSVLQWIEYCLVCLLDGPNACRIADRRKRADRLYAGRPLTGSSQFMITLKLWFQGNINFKNAIW